MKTTCKPVVNETRSGGSRYPTVARYSKNKIFGSGRLWSRKEQKSVLPRYFMILGNGASLHTELCLYTKQIKEVYGNVMN